MSVREAADEFVTEAVGRSQRDDAVLERTGGPAGNARLTAWTGLLLLALFLAELVTVLNVQGYLSWHSVNLHQPSNRPGRAGERNGSYAADLRMAESAAM
jgi:hypothetical protein